MTNIRQSWANISQYGSHAPLLRNIRQPLTKIAIPGGQPHGSLGQLAIRETNPRLTNTPQPWANIGIHGANPRVGKRPWRENIPNNLLVLVFALGALRGPFHGAQTSTQQIELNCNLFGPFFAFWALIGLSLGGKNEPNKLLGPFFALWPLGGPSSESL